MSHIAIRRIVTDKSEYIGDKWWYEFTCLPKKCEDAKVQAYCRRLSQQFARSTKVWTEDLNSEWMCRVYFAVRMVFSASVMAMSLDYARKKNLRIVESYLEYYMVLNSLRAVLLTLPSQPWSDGALMEANHTKTINAVLGAISQISKPAASELGTGIRHLKALREYISYRGASDGGAYKGPPFDATEWARLLLEVAQMQSELLERSVIKNAATGHTLKPAYIAKICRVEIEGVVFDDKEDNYRLEYLQRKHPLPANILHMVAEGHVEDYFGSWCAKKAKRGAFNADGDWRILFDLP